MLHKILEIIKNYFKKLKNKSIENECGSSLWNKKNLNLYVEKVLGLASFSFSLKNSQNIFSFF